ncbi:MAG: alcohol dehydrogenase catalytic domain-containing protein [Thermodesulfovibrionia bacterium]|nr:alcohol dehydrogenase catalytic domain-containing protein [Thermodesulfovibrionia bacterium]
MRVAVYHRNDDIRIEERPKPVISDGEILVKMMASGICGTDVMEWYRIKKAPRILGHEMAGEVAAVGRAVKNFKKGDRVFVSHHVPCYNCHHCAQGNFTACETLHTGNYDPGGFSEFIRVPEQNVKYGTFRLPEKMTFDDAAMIEPLGCVVAGQHQLSLTQGHSVLIIGSGISGLLHTQMAKMKGARVITTDIDEYRLHKAAEFGADYALNAAQYSADTLRSINNDKLADSVIICSAAEQAVSNALSSVERKGKMLFFAVPNADIEIPSQRFWRDEITVTFSYGASPHDLREALELIENERVNVKDMITHRVTLSDIQKGFMLVSKAKNSLKVVVLPDN